MKREFVSKKSSPEPQESDKAPIKLRKKITARYLENSGAHYLQRFAASSARFKQVMTRKIDLSCRDHPEQNREDCLALLDQIVIKFIDLGYLNDPSFAKGLFYSLSLRGYSRQKILAHMKMKGVPEQDIRECLGAENHEHELAMAVRYIKRKKLGSFSLRDIENGNQKALASLARNGFGYDVASKALNLSKDEAMSILDKMP